MKVRLLHWLYGRPQLFRLWAFFNPKLRRLLPRHDTALCLDGFPRSGNTFATISFLKAQERDVHVSHHLHSEGQILFSIRRNIPILVLIRDPVDAVASLVVRHPEYTIQDALRRYIALYSALLPHLDHVVVSNFEQTTSGLTAIVKSLNEKFGTTFAPPAASGVEDQEVFEAIDKLNADNEGGAAAQLARPTADREPLLDDKKKLIRLSPELGVARAIYEKICQTR